MSTTTLPRGLGKGLSALISENSAAPTAKPSATTTGNITSLAPSQLTPGKYQPRSYFDDTALEELADSIRKNGIMQPLIVRVSGKNNGRYEIIAGERRWRAAKLAGLNSVPAIIRELDDRQALELALIENIQRQDLSSLEEALGYQRLSDDFAYTQEELAQAVGKSRSHVSNLLRLLSLPEEVRVMIEKGELTAGHARALLNAPNPIELAKQIVARGLNVRQAERVGREAQGAPRKPPGLTNPGSHYREPVHRDPDLVRMEEGLSESLGIPIRILSRGDNAGEVVLPYDSLAALDKIMQRLTA